MKNKNIIKWNSNSDFENKIGDFVCSQGNYDPSKYGNCNEINATVAFILYELGFNVKPCSGYVEVEKSYRNDSIENEFYYDPNHFWIKSDNRIIDLANLQFEGNVQNYDLTRVKYVQTRIHSINNQWVNKTIVNEIKKQKWFLMEVFK